jgi:hypothetical protein
MRRTATHTILCVLDEQEQKMIPAADAELKKRRTFLAGTRRLTGVWAPTSPGSTSRPSKLPGGILVLEVTPWASEPACS